MLFILGRIGHLLRHLGFYEVQLMLSILGRIGHLLRHPDFYEDQLDVVHTRPDRSFIAPSGFL